MDKPFYKKPLYIGIGVVVLAAILFFSFGGTIGKKSETATSTDEVLLDENATNTPETVDEFIGIADLEAEIERLEGVIVSLNNTISTLETKVANLEKERDQLKDDLDSERDKVTSLNNQISSLNSTITSLRNQLNQVKTDRDYWKEKYQDTPYYRLDQRKEALEERLEDRQRDTSDRFRSPRAPRAPRTR